MADPAPQTYANHTRWHPPFHFVMAPLALLTVILATINLVRHYDDLVPWILELLSIVALLAGFLARVNPLKAQDRVIRLEERARMQALLPEPLRSRIPELTESQLVALRFASDGELAVLVQKTLQSNLKSADIKKSIVNWRPDTFRV